MNEELDFENYPALHLHLMVDDYDELIRQNEHREKEVEAEIPVRNDHDEIDPQGRFSFCFV